MKAPDPRIMLLIAACFSTMGAAIKQTWLLSFVFIASVLLDAALRVDLVTLVKRLKKLLLLAGLISLLQSFSGSGEILLRLGKMTILTTGGLLLGANTLLRFGTVICSAAIFTLTTSRMMIQALIQLKVPYDIAFMALVALRFLPVFSEEFRDTVTAIQLRGVNLKRIPIRKKISIFKAIIMPVTYGAMDKAQKLSCAMELRAFRAFTERTSRITLKMATADYVYMFAFPMLTVAVLAYSYIY